MTFKAAKCPNCAGELQVPDDRDTVKCMYCGSDIIVREAIKAAAGGVNIENLLTLAKNAETAGNHDEAYKYYSTVLEHDSRNVEAWIGKGKTRPEDFNQMKLCFDKAMDYSSDKGKTEFVIKDFIKIIIAKHPMRYDLDNPTRFAYISMLLDLFPNDSDGLIWKGSLWCSKLRADCVQCFKEALIYANNKDQTRKRIIKLITMSLRLLPEEIDPYRQGIQIIKDYLSEIDSDGSERIILKKADVEAITRAVNQDYEGYVREQSKDKVFRLYKDFNSFMEHHDLSHRNKLIEEIKAVDRSYQPPSLSFNESKGESKGACFIATAAYGSPMASEVTVLRTFRDEHLEATEWGKAFIKYYYLIGPHIARLIDKSQLLRAFTRQLLKPVIFTVKKYHRGNKP